MLTAIPTRYAGVQFRSRLEARWAAFFDIAGWRWQYEPFDLAGWIPDFRLCGKVPALCEVKPIDFTEFDSADKGQNGTISGIEKAFNYIREIAPNVIRACDRFNELKSSDINLQVLDHEIIVLGLGPAPSTIGVPILGYMLHEHWSCCEDWAVICSGHEPQRLDYISKRYNWNYRVGGQYAGRDFDHLKFIKNCDVENLWREAGNLVQWKSPAQVAEVIAAKGWVQP